jgi:circadian clock protein KaiC
VVKYRGTAHGTNEYPFLIDESGFSVLPITSVGLDHQASAERISTGIARLDAMLGGPGIYRGSSVLVSGTAGTGKSSIAATFAHESCARGERCLYFAFEESESQIVRNMGSIGIDFRPWIKKGLLRFVAGRPTATGLEMHLALMHREVKQFQPRTVVVDPISNLAAAGQDGDAARMLTRLVDFLKTEQITGVFTALTTGAEQEQTDVGVSSVIDTWLLLRSFELGGERNRGLYVIKSRGMAHSNQVREFLLTSRGIDLLDVYVGSEGVLTGSMRKAQEARELEAEESRSRDADAKRRSAERRGQLIEAQIASLRSDLEEHQEEMKRLSSSERDRITRRSEGQTVMARSRKADGSGATSKSGPASGSGGRAGARAGVRN